MNSTTSGVIPISSTNQHVKKNIFPATTSSRMYALISIRGIRRFLLTRLCFSMGWLTFQHVVNGLGLSQSFIVHPNHLLHNELIVKNRDNVTVSEAYRINMFQAYSNCLVLWNLNDQILLPRPTKYDTDCSEI